MSSQRVSRRSLLIAAGLGAGAAAVGAGLGPRAYADLTPPPAGSPFLPGPFKPARIILGEASGTAGLPQFITQADIPIPIDSYNFVCRDGRVVPVELPQRILGAVYYPQLQVSKPPRDNPFGVDNGPFPVVLYAHGVRAQFLACFTPFPIERDFTRVDTILKHLASYGCVVVAPDLSWLPGDGPDVGLHDAFNLRARVLMMYFQFLAQLNPSVFAGQLDFSRLMLVGHSTGAGAATIAGRKIASVLGFKSLSYGFLGPYFRLLADVPEVGLDTKNLLVVHGTLDGVSGVSASGAFDKAGAPKTQVTIPGANHFGYTHLCQLDNTCEGVPDVSGTVSRQGQQSTAAAYLAALLRFHALGDGTVRPYLQGTRIVEGPEIWGVTGLDVKSKGLEPPPEADPNP